MFKVTIITPPTTYPVTLSEVKTHLSIDEDNTTYDNKLQDLISQVRSKVERFCGISIGEQTREWIYDFDPDFAANVPYGPVASITSVHKKSGAEYEELDDDQYEYETGLIWWLDGHNKVRYVTGTDYNTCPDDLKLGILDQIKYEFLKTGDEKLVGGFWEPAYNNIIGYKDFSWE